MMSAPSDAHDTNATHPKHADSYFGDCIGLDTIGWTFREPVWHGLSSDVCQATCVCAQRLVLLAALHDIAAEGRIHDYQN